MRRPIVGQIFFARRKGRLAVRKTFSTCAFISVVGLMSLAEAQIIPPYHGPGAEGQYSHGSHHSPETLGQGQTFGPAGGRYHGGPTQNGPAAPSYWTYNRFSNNGFGGLNWFYGPLGGYTPFVTPYGSTTYGYPSFGPYYSYVPLAPVIRQRRPYWIGGDPFANNVNNNAQPPANPVVNPNLGAGQPAQEPVQSNVRIFGKTPTTDALRRSIRYQAQGDEWFAKQNYLQAYGHYKQAITAAPGRPEPKFRLALALAATTNYGSAVDEIKRAMRLDPTWPQTGPKLDELFGADNLLSKNAVMHKVAAWVREDIRDPDRLFLMGVLLHFNDEADKSHTFFEAASALAPVPAYAQAFLTAEERQQANRPVEEPRPAPFDDAAPQAEPAPSDSAARADPAARAEPAKDRDGPRFPPAAMLDDAAQVGKRAGSAPRNNPGNNPGNGSKVFPRKAPANAPAKAPEEPKPRPLADNGADHGTKMQHGAGPVATISIPQGVCVAKPVAVFRQAVSA